MISEHFELEGYATRGIKLQGKTTEVATDTHARISPVEVLAKLRSVYPGGVQTGGNSAALVDAAAAAIVASGSYTRELGLDLSKLNVNGGAIALGHPLACTGVRLTLTLAREMQLSGVRYGVSSACIGGGQGIALLLENPEGV